MMTKIPLKALPQGLQLDINSLPSPDTYKPQHFALAFENFETPLLDVLVDPLGEIRDAVGKATAMMKVETILGEANAWQHWLEDIENVTLLKEYHPPVYSDPSNAEMSINEEIVLQSLMGQVRGNSSVCSLIALVLYLNFISSEMLLEISEVHRSVYKVSSASI